jgi:hypothetical protein
MNRAPGSIGTPLELAVIIPAWNERLAEAAASRWGRPGPTLLVYRLREEP